MKLIKVGLSVAAILTLVACNKGKGEEAVKEMCACTDLKCVSDVSTKYKADDVKAFTTDQQSKYLECTTKNSIGGMFNAFGSAFGGAGGK